MDHSVYMCCSAVMSSVESVVYEIKQIIEGVKCECIKPRLVYK